jgi:putative metal-binding protein
MREIVAIGLFVVACADEVKCPGGRTLQMDQCVCPVGFVEMGEECISLDSGASAATDVDAGWSDGSRDSGLADDAAKAPDDDGGLGVKDASGGSGCMPLSTETCTAGSGDCVGTGSWVCDATTGTPRCTAVEKPKNACGVSCGPVPAEICDGKDNDCDGMIDEEPDVRWFADCDLDGFTASGPGTASCAQPAATAACTTWLRAASSMADCNDGDARVHPGASQSPSSNAPNPSEGALFSVDIDCNGRVEKPSEWQYFGAASQWLTVMLPLCPSSATCDGATVGKCYRNTSSPGAVLGCGYTEIEVFSSSSCSTEVATARVICK